MMSAQKKFAAVMGIVALAILLVGWVTAVRHVMHGALLSVAVFALLPFVVIALGLLLALVLGLIAAAAGGDAGDVDAQGAGALVEGGVSMTGRYYRFLSRQRQPIFWAIPAGVLLGGLLLWGLIATVVLPGEARTAQILSEAMTRLAAGKETTGYPEPVDGHLIEEGKAVLDGFGRPLAYAVAGKWKLATFTLSSSGFDGKPGGDDLCVAGGSTLARWTKAVLNLGARKANLTDKLGAISELKCPE